MSTPVVFNPPTTAQQPQNDGVKVVKDTPGVQYIEREFEDGDAKGLKYVVPQFKTLADAVKATTRPEVKDAQGNVTQDAVDGNALLLGIINQTVVQRVAMKVKGQVLPRIDTKTEEGKKSYAEQVNAIKARDPQGYVYGVKEAEEFRLGVREPSLQEQMDDLFNKIKTGAITSKEDIANMVLKLQAKRRSPKS